MLRHHDISASDNQNFTPHVTQFFPTPSSSFGSYFSCVIFVFPHAASHSSSLWSLYLDGCLFGSVAEGVVVASLCTCVLDRLVTDAAGDECRDVLVSGFDDCLDPLAADSVGDD